MAQVQVMERSKMSPEQLERVETRLQTRLLKQEYERKQREAELKKNLKRVRTPQSTTPPQVKRSEFYSVLEGMEGMDEKTKKKFMDAYDERLKKRKTKEEK